MEYPSVSFIRIHSICWQANHRWKPANIAIWRFHTESAWNALLEKRGLCCRDQWHKQQRFQGSRAVSSRSLVKERDFNLLKLTFKALHTKQWPSFLNLERVFICRSLRSSRCKRLQVLWKMEPSRLRLPF